MYLENQNDSDFLYNLLQKLCYHILELSLKPVNVNLEPGNA